MYFLSLFTSNVYKRNYIVFWIQIIKSLFKVMYVAGWLEREREREGHLEVSQKLLTISEKIIDHTLLSIYKPEYIGNILVNIYKVF